MIRLTVTPGTHAVVVLTEVKKIAWYHPGDHELHLRTASATLKLGPRWRYDACPECVADLEQFGKVEVEEVQA